MARSAFIKIFVTVFWAVCCFYPITAHAGYISVGSVSNPWDAVLDGWRNAGSSQAYHQGSADGSHGWGQYQGWGWLASRWQTVGDSSVSGINGSYLWIDNFNALEAIFGSADNHQDITSQSLWSVEQTFNDINLYLYDGEALSQGQEALITQEQKDASIKGKLKLNSIGFAMDGRNGIMTISGTVVEGDMVSLLGSQSSFSWTLTDWDNGTGLNNTNNVWNLLNPQSDHENGGGNPHPQQHLSTQGGSVGGESSVPEPASVLLLGSAVGLLGFLQKRLRKK